MKQSLLYHITYQLKCIICVDGCNMLHGTEDLLLHCSKAVNNGSYC